MRMTPSNTSTTRRMGAVALLYAALLTAFLLVAAGSVRAEDGAESGNESGRKSMLADIKKDPKNYKDLIEAAREYFDPEEEPWRGRMALLGELEKQAAEGRYFLKDLPALRWLVSQGREFLPDLTDRKWQRAQGITEAKKLPGTLYSIKSEDLTITFAVPRKYPDERDLRKIPREDPWPLLLTLHRKGDYTGQKYPGETLIKRVYGDKKLWAPIYEKWLVLAPIAAAGNFVDDGKPRRAVFTDPFSVFWKHYHVDFDRVVLDGEEPAFSIAAAMPVFFAGVVFRGKWKLTEKQKEQVKNFGNVPVYVVDNTELAKQLEEAGHPNVTKGIANAQLVKWMQERRRKTATSFEWNAMRSDQVLAYWINLDGANWSAPERKIKVEVVDTKKEPNTIKIEADGMQSMSFFLNDEIVDLDRSVRVLVNGNVEHDGKIPLQDKHMEKVGRDFDFLFNRDPLTIRRSMYFGWLTPARLVEVDVRPRAKKTEPKKEVAKGPQATPEQEQKAERYMFKARAFLQQGADDKALESLDKILALPRNAQTDEATAMRDKLKKASEKSGDSNKTDKKSGK